jgi:cyd operon protein YbgE
MTLYRSSFRLLSLVMALALSVIILIVPHAVTNADNSVNHTHLMLLLYGMMIGFIHGMGFVPNTTIFRLMFHPIIGWILMIGASIVVTTQ